MEVDTVEIGHYLKLLAEAPRRISAATKGIPIVQLILRTDDEPWSVNDILAHLRACSDVRERYIQAMLTQNKPTMRYISPRTYIKKTKYLELAFAESFQAYKKQRAGLLKTLKNLSLKVWSRSAIIKEREETVFSYTSYLVGHETVHVEQIEELLK